MRSSATLTSQLTQVNTQAARLPPNTPRYSTKYRKDLSCDEHVKTYRPLLSVALRASRRRATPLHANNGVSIQIEQPRMRDIAVVDLRQAYFPDTPGVYAVFDEGDTLVYIGMARSLSSSMRDHAHCISPSESKCVKFLELGGSSREALQVVWKSWIKELGAIPAGNMKGQVQWTKRAPAEQTAAPPPLRPPAYHRSEAASALISEAVVSALSKDGYVVLDDVLDADTVAKARRDCELLKKNDVMRYVEGGSQIKLGRSDMVCVLDEQLAGRELLCGSGKSDGRGGEAMTPLSSLAPGQEGSGLAKVAAFMKGLPHAVMEKLGAASGGAVHPHLAVPHSLMLAVYPGEGTHYVAHLDNDETDARTREGPAGQRICDREITAIIYLNSDWEEADGGALRLALPDGSGDLDILPTAGRLVLLQSRLIWHEVLPAYTMRWALSAWIPRALESY
mmetsp:Transcript_32557/g.58276  ORF Transcript_32557/g.58276 Transcript_32557/m.58276 type:complete len:450 (-) Transcript_32557:916-2265(-)